MQGSNSPEAFRLAGQRAATALTHYESAPQPELVQQGQEPQQLLAALGASDTHSWQPQDCAAYDEDFQVTFAPPISLCLLGSAHCAVPVVLLHIPDCPVPIELLCPLQSAH